MAIDNTEQILQQVQRVNQAVQAFTSLLYKTIEGIPINVSIHNNRIQIDIPWGEAGSKAYHFDTTERSILRTIMLTRALTSRTPFAYKPAKRTWHWNADGFRSLGLANGYWKNHPITPQEWIRAASEYSAQRVAAVAASRQRSQVNRPSTQR